MINYEEALKILKESLIKLPVENLDITKASGFVSAENINSKIALPSFNNSAMDGFAFKSVDVTKANKDAPVKLLISKTIEAGDDDSDETQSLRAVEIMTGAKMPEGFDAVILVEKANIITQGDERFLIVDEAVPAKTNVRYIGEDFQINDEIISVGELITPNHLMALTGVGVSSIKVKKMPKITVISTGKEIIDQYDHALKEGQIYNSNSPYIVSYLRNFGFEVSYYGIIADDIADFHKAIDEIEASSDLIISTGAVSMGKKDFIKEELINRKAEILFHKVAIRPGKPILFAKSDKYHYFGLPGNPISSVVGLQAFIMPFIRESLGIKSKKTVTAILKNSHQAKSGLLHFLKSYSYLENGKLMVEILDGQQSFKINPLIKANSLSVINGGEAYEADVLVEILPITNLLTDF